MTSQTAQQLFYSCQKLCYPPTNIKDFFFQKENCNKHVIYKVACVDDNVATLRDAHTQSPVAVYIVVCPSTVKHNDEGWVVAQEEEEEVSAKGG